MTRALFGLAFAGLIATVDLVALTIELVTSLDHSLALDRGIGEALYLHFRFFTILINWGLASLMVATIAQAARRRRAPSASLYGAVLIYILVVGTTYELLLRRTGTAKNIFFFTDMIMHDIVPLFYLAFWLGFAPKRGLTWRDALLWLAFPAGYLGLTLVFGLFGQGYPYFFFDVAAIGYEGVVTNALMFLVAFFILGLGTVMLSRVMRSGNA